ncbi:MAG: S-layer homology domain-containing protein [Cyanobacteria bacterium P01_D01_bin.2]
MLTSKFIRPLTAGLAFSLILGGWVGTATPSFSQPTPPLAHLAQANGVFSDIGGTLYEAEITRAAQMGFIAGPGDGTFRPNDTVTREQAVSIILSYGGVTDAQLAGVANPFRDVPSGRWSEAKIAYAAQNGIVAGRGNGRFDPTATVTRAELMAMLANAYEIFAGARGEPYPAPNFTFSDVAGHWAEGTVAWMSRFCGGVARPLNDSGLVFAPDMGATRAYTAAAVARLADCNSYEAGVASSGSNTNGSSNLDSQATGSLSQAEINQLLTAHNRYRVEVGVPALTWSPTLTASAQQWANQLAAEGAFYHSNTNSGENLAAGTTGAYSLTDLVDLWGAEKANYIPGRPLSEASTTGNFGDIGHYTQVVWRDTTEVGCGVATSGGQSILVCQYNPAGNFNNGIPY